MTRQLTFSDITDQRTLTESADATTDDIPGTPTALLDRAQQHVADVATEHFPGLPIEAIDWEISHRAQRQAGVTKYDTTTEAITIALTWTAYEQHGWEQFSSPVRHELIHAWQYHEFGDANHGATFTRWTDNLDTSQHCERFTTPKWWLVCEDCGGWLQFELRPEWVVIGDPPGEWIQLKLPPGKRDVPEIEIYAGKHVCVDTGKHILGTPLKVDECDEDALYNVLEEYDQLPTTRDESSDPAGEHEEFNVEEYTPTVMRSGETTDDIRDIFAALDYLDAQRVATRTIVHRWNDSASTSDGKRAFVPTWGTNANGTANVVDSEIWQDTGGDGYGGPVVMALIRPPPVFQRRGPPAADGRLRSVGGVPRRAEPERRPLRRGAGRSGDDHRGTRPRGPGRDPVLCRVADHVFDVI